MKRLLHSQAFRLPIVVIAALAWFALSNHCALGTLIASEAKGSVSPMHCHGDQPSPAKRGDESTPCCKVLKAVTIAKANIGAQADGFALKEPPIGDLTFAIWQAHTHTLELDTGPPKARSFSESVLQRSILAHAPPFSLS